ncbi:MAG: hypothetical protein ABR575_00225 [Actinomycetota bacterium]
MAVDPNGRIGIVERCDRRPGGSVFRGVGVFDGLPWSSRHPRALSPIEERHVAGAISIAKSAERFAENMQAQPRWKRWILKKLGM